MTTNLRRGVFGAMVLTSFSALAGLSVTAPASAAPAADAYQQGGSYYFVSPSSQWRCAIVTSAGQPAWAGCKGPISANAPSVQGGGVQSIHPNGVSVSTAKPGALTFYSDTSVSSSDPASVKVLPYGATLTAGGVSCTVDVVRGVTCESGAHSFTVSSDGYQLR